MEKQKNYENKLAHYNGKIKLYKKYTQKECILEFLQSKPTEWFYIWEIMGAKNLGWISHKAQARVNEMVHEGLIETKYIGKYAVHSLKIESKVELPIDTQTSTLFSMTPKKEYEKQSYENN